MEPHNPNFPLNLNIHPSSPNTYSATRQLAIHKYGIAGREASYAVTFYIHPSSGFEFDPPLIDGSRNSITIIELGFGSGMGNYHDVVALVSEHSTEQSAQYSVGIDTSSLIIVYKISSLAKESSFWSAFGLWFKFRPVIRGRSSDSEWQRFGSDLGDTILLFLLGGVGAHGKKSGKDDTFENLLIMAIQQG
ncbi:hypothetical protein BYT27DRAFT_7193256 [Phlegmacium glaucopus]|nr:hypothetical protein BYT27DRAFT_7193256 [Phlegmacium glaucopus]